jgi:hypothetical protein
MEEILKYENRQKLYQFLLDEYGFKVIREEYYEHIFGNFIIDLESIYFYLRYYNDREILSIDIASLSNKKDWFALSFIKDLIYNPDAIDADETKRDNATRINLLNNFLRKDFDKIADLMSETNYPDTQKRLDKGLRKQFFIKYPNAGG